MISPLVLLVIAVATVGFESLVFGGDLVEKSVITSVPNPTCDGQAFDNVFEKIACYIRSFIVGLVNTFLMVASVVLFFFNALTFNVPGAPNVVRVLMGTVFIGGMGWAIASLFRGTSA